MWDYFTISIRGVKVISQHFRARKYLPPGNPLSPRALVTYSMRYFSAVVPWSRLRPPSCPRFVPWRWSSELCLPLCTWVCLIGKSYSAGFHWRTRDIIKMSINHFCECCVCVPAERCHGIEAGMFSSHNKLALTKRWRFHLLFVTSCGVQARTVFSFQLFEMLLWRIAWRNTARGCKTFFVIFAPFVPPKIHMFLLLIFFPFAVCGKLRIKQISINAAIGIFSSVTSWSLLVASMIFFSDVVMHYWRSFPNTSRACIDLELRQQVLERP